MPETHIVERDSMLHVPAAASLDALCRADAAPELLRQTLKRALSWQHRVDFSVERVLMSPKLAACWVAGLLALDAQVAFDGDGDAPQPLAAFLNRNAAKPGRLSAVQVPVAGAGQVWGRADVSALPASAPIVTVAAVLQIEGDIVRDARIALTGVWPEYARLADAARQLIGGPLDDARIAHVAEAVEHEVNPPGDFNGSVAYRRAMAAVLTRQALEMCGASN